MDSVFGSPGLNSNNNDVTLIVYWIVNVFFFRLQINDSLLYWWNDNDYRFNCLWQWCGSMKNREKKTPKPNQTERNGTKTVFWRKSIESWMKKKLVLFIVVIIYGAVGIVGICHRQSPNGATKESIKFLRSVGEKKKNNSWLSFPSIDGSWVMICVGFCSRIYIFVCLSRNFWLTRMRIIQNSFIQC